MTVSTEVNQAAYTGNGVTTVFPYTFRILNASNLTVTRIDLLEVETVLTLGTDYTVSGAGTYNGGAVNLIQPLPYGYSLVIERDLAAVQETDLRNQGTFFAEVHEDVFDYLTMLVQQVSSWLGLALRRPTIRSKFYDAKQYRIANMADPVNDQDAVNTRSMRSYVEKMVSGVVGGFGWFIQAGAGAVYRTFQDKMRESISPEDFGAVGNGADDFDALVLTLNAARSSGKKIKLSQKYYSSKTITISSLYVRIDGDSQQSSGITFASGCGLIVDNSGTTVVRRPLQLESIHIKTRGLRNATALDFTGNGGIRYAKQLILRDVDISSADDGNYAFDYCFKLTRAGQSLFDNVNVSGAGTDVPTSRMGRVFDLFSSKNVNVVNGSYQNFDTFMDAHDDTEGVVVAFNHIIAGRRGVVSENNTGNLFQVNNNHFNTSLSAVELGDGSTNGGNHSIVSDNFCIVFDGIPEDAATPYIGFNSCANFGTFSNNEVLLTGFVKDATHTLLRGNTAGTRFASYNTISNPRANQLTRNIQLAAGSNNNQIYATQRVGINLANNIIDAGTNNRWWIFDTDVNAFMMRDMKLCNPGVAELRQIRFYTTTDTNTPSAILRVSGGVAGVGGDGTAELTAGVTTFKLIRPSAANTYTCGASAYPWSGGFTQTAFTVTSDEEEKSRPVDITDVMLDAWSEVEFCQYQYVDRIIVKGDDSARWHFGLVAQRAEEAFARHGLNASEYGFFCRDSGEEMPELRDEEGEIYQEYQPAFTKCGIRYEEALVLEAALQRRNYHHLDERIKALEIQ